MKRLNSRLEQIEQQLGLNEPPLDIFQFSKLLKVLSNEDFEMLGRLLHSNDPRCEIEKLKLAAKYKKQMDHYVLSSEEIKKIEELNSKIERQVNEHIHGKKANTN